MKHSPPGAPHSKKGDADRFLATPFETKRKTRVKCHTIIQQECGSIRSATLVHLFEFYRFRCWFQAADEVRFPASSANTVRGAFGKLLRDTASAETYNRLFEPHGAPRQGPSGLADRPRPFVFRSAHLNAAIVAPGDRFFFDAHVFELQHPVLPALRAAFERIADAGLGPGRGRARLLAIDTLDLNGRPSNGACSLPFSADPTPVRALTVRFVTPTELKAGGQVRERPEFGFLLARIRDRVATLSALYGSFGPLPVDFREIGRRASEVRLVRDCLTWESASRKSTRTGQTHPLGGFTGTAEYEGDLAEFVPWLRVARWTGVGRQTVWGKGEVHIVAPPAVTGAN
ncbi:MAG: hypothetical protein C5B51_10345 [Terriglobia bacterium]|nr:MAG: hypothetical protein C5B51_10345 [Terriglobia bacterium]